MKQSDLLIKYKENNIATSTDIKEFATWLKNGMFFEEKIEDIIEKLNFYNRIEIYGTILTNFTYMFQRIELSYARYQHLSSLGIKINNSNATELFTLSKDFKIKYGKNTQELLEEYNYDSYKNLSSILDEMNNKSNNKNRTLNLEIKNKYD